MKALLKTGAFLLGLSVVLTAVSYNVLRAQGLDQSPPAAGARKLTSESRPIDGKVTVVKLNGSVDLRLKQGATPAMTVYAEQRYLHNITTEQNGDTLTIGISGTIINTRQPMVVDLTLPALAQVRSTGSGNSRISGFHGDSLQLMLHGSGDMGFTGQYRQLSALLEGSGDLFVDNGTNDSVDLRMVGSGNASIKGSTKALKANLMGSGDLKAANLAAETVNVDLMGSGDATVTATREISGSLLGSGNLNVAGSPSVQRVTRHGSGDVNWQ